MTIRGHLKFSVLLFLLGSALTHRYCQPILCFFPSSVLITVQPTPCKFSHCPFAHTLPRVSMNPKTQPKLYLLREVLLRASICNPLVFLELL